MLISWLGPCSDDWRHCLLLLYHSSSFVFRGVGSWLSNSDDFIRYHSPLDVSSSVSDSCCHFSVSSSVSARSMLSMSSVSACVLLWLRPLMFCGLCLSDADWKWSSMVSKQANNALHPKTLSSVSSTSYTVKAVHRPNHRCPQKRSNEIGLLRHRIQEEMVLNYLCKQLGEVCFMKRSRAKKNWNKERAKKLNNTGSMLWFKAVLNS